MYQYKAKVIRVIDADTIKCVVDVGFGISVNQRFRILGYDAPETFRPKTDEERQLGERATEIAKNLLLDMEVIVNTQKTDVYGRYLATVTLSDGTDYAQRMIAEGWTKPINTNNIIMRMR